VTEPPDDNDKSIPSYPDQPELSGDRPARRPMFGPFTGDGSSMPQSNRMPVAALVLGIASIPFGILTGFLGIVCGLLAVILGLIGMRQVKRGTATKSRFAIGGIVIGVVGLIVAIVVLIISVHRINDCKKHIGHTPSQKELTQCARDHV
jgi:hypothetical protein